MTSNPSTEDRTGWDFVVELPPSNAQSRPVTCKVQVKTVGADVTSIPIALSHWRNMVRDHVPWFVVVISIDDADRTRAVHLLSVEGTVIDRAVKSLARTSKVKLSKRVMTVNVADCRAVGESQIFDEIRTVIGDPVDYLQKKVATLALAQEKALETRGQLTFEFSSREEFIRHAAEFAVGLRTELPFRRFTLAERSLGVDGRKVDHGTGGTISIPELPSMGTSTVVLKKPERALRLAREFETRTSLQVFPFIPEEEALIRLVSPLLSITFKRSTHSTNFNIKLTGIGPRVAAKQLGEAAEFFLELSSVSAEGTEVEIQFPNNTSPTRVLNATSQALDVSEDLKSHLLAFRDAWRVLQRFGLQSEDVEPDELAMRGNQIRTIALVLSGQTLRLNASFAVSEPQLLAEETKEVAVLHVPGFTTAARAVLAATAIIGRAERINDDRRFGVVEPRAEVVLTDVVARSGAATAVKRLRQRAVELLEKRGLIVVLGS